MFSAGLGLAPEDTRSISGVCGNIRLAANLREQSWRAVVLFSGRFGEVAVSCATGCALVARLGLQCSKRG
jgi:hypothetical protein